MSDDQEQALRLRVAELEKERDDLRQMIDKTTAIVEAGLARADETKRKWAEAAAKAAAESTAESTAETSQLNWAKYFVQEKPDAKK